MQAAILYWDPPNEKAGLNVELVPGRRLAEEIHFLGADYALGPADTAVRKCSEFIQLVRSGREDFTSARLLRRVGRRFGTGRP